MQRQLKEARRRLRAFFPRGFELVFDNYNALVIGISASGSTSDAFISVAGYPQWVTLFFLHGVDLPDRNGLLEGGGKQVRSIRLVRPSQINDPEVEAIIAAAAIPHRPMLQSAPPLATVVRTAVTSQRPRRPSVSATVRSARASRTRASGK